jgi:hypothetical protein
MTDLFKYYKLPIVNYFNRYGIAFDYNLLDHSLKYASKSSTATPFNINVAIFRQNNTFGYLTYQVDDDHMYKLISIQRIIKENRNFAINKILE